MRRCVPEVLLIFSWLLLWFRSVEVPDGPTCCFSDLPVQSPEVASEQSADSTHDSTRAGASPAMHSYSMAMGRLMPALQQPSMGSPTLQASGSHAVYTHAQMLHGSPQQGCQTPASASCPLQPGLPTLHGLPEGSIHGGHQDCSVPLHSQPLHLSSTDFTMQDVPPGSPCQPGDFPADDVFADHQVSGLLDALLDEQNPDMPFGLL